MNAPHDMGGAVLLPEAEEPPAATIGTTDAPDLAAIVAEAAALPDLTFEAQRKALAARAGIAATRLDKLRQSARREAEAQRKRADEEAARGAADNAAAGGGSAAPQDRDAVITEAADMPEAEYRMQRADLAARAGLGMVSLDKLRAAERAKRRAKDAEDYRSASPPAPGEGLRLPPGYLMRKGGLHFDAGTDAAPLYICPPFALLGETRAPNGTQWGKWLRWSDADGRQHLYAVDNAKLYARDGSLEGELAGLRFIVNPEPAAVSAFRRFLAEVQTGDRATLIERSGWHAIGGASVYALPDGTTFGSAAEEMVMPGARDDAAGRCAERGSLSTWQQEVAALAVGNDRLALFIAAAFHGPLLEIEGVESGGYHLAGGSSTGKSTALEAAASVWGPPTKSGAVRTWRATANGLEGVAAETSDALLPLDELSEANGRDVDAALYMLPNESGKMRATRDGAARTRKTWRLLILSTGELTPADKLAEVGQRAKAGQDARIASIPADAGAGFGAFQTLHGAAHGGALSERLKAGALRNYGTAARAYLEALAAARADDEAQLRRFIGAVMGDFLATHVPDKADGQVRRVAKRFALTAAAGELARAFGVLPWPEGEAARAAGACFAVWLSRRGSHGAAEAEEAEQRLRHFLAQHGASRFETIGAGERVQNRVGWRTREEGGAWRYYIAPECWRRDIFAGMDGGAAAVVLAERRLIQRGEGRHLTQKVSISGEGRPRVYVVAPGMFDAGEGAERDGTT
jgi:putative DNA primase/helicase